MGKFRSERDSGNTYYSIIELATHLVAGDKCAIATRDPDKYIKDFEKVTGHRIKLSKKGKNVFNAKLVKK